MEQSVRLGYGFGLAVLSVAFFVLYFPVLIIFFTDKEFRRTTAYVIITHIGVADVLQLIIHMYSAVLVIADIELNSIIQKGPVYSIAIVQVVGAVLTGLWFSMLIFILFLTFNRLSTIVLEKWFPVLTSSWLNHVLFAVSYLSFLAPFVLKLLPDCNYVFNPDTFSWSYLPSDAPLSTIMSDTSRYLILVTVILSTFTYVSIFCHIGFCSSSRMSKREFRITIQVSMIVLYFLFSFVYWNYLMPLFGKSTLLDYLSCIVWVAMNGIHSIIYLTFNRRLRSSFYYMVTKLKIPHDTSSVARPSVIVVKASKW